MLTHTIPITITKQQILDFANLTGDDSAIHTVEGVVQGGLILSMLPKWFCAAKEDGRFTQSLEDSITIKMNSRFTNPFFADDKVHITFNYNPLKLGMSKITWTIHDYIEHCSGEWIVIKL